MFEGTHSSTGLKTGVTADDNVDVTGETEYVDSFFLGD